MASEAQMEAAVAHWLERRSVPVVCQVALDNVRFDVVAYDKDSGIFKVVECKPTRNQTNIAKAFGQISAYFNKISAKPDEFVDCVSEKMPMRFRRWMEATDSARRIRVEFFVALRDESCRDVPFLRELKKDNQHVGIIRYKRDGACRSYVKEDGERNRELARATSKTIPLRGAWSAGSVKGTS